MRPYLYSLLEQFEMVCVSHLWRSLYSLAAIRNVTAIKAAIAHNIAALT